MNAQDIKRIVMERKLSLVPYPGLSNIQHALINIKENKFKGHFVETGSWKGGACMYARALMNEMGIEGKVYVCDSFKGVPPPDTANYPLDEGDGHHNDKELSISREEVENYFREYDLLNGVVFVEGWFKDSLPQLAEQIEDIAILRLDGDMYESTMQALDALYDKVIMGGIIIVDDYGLDRCKWAIDDFWKKRNFVPDLRLVEHTTIALWQKGTAVKV